MRAALLIALLSGCNVVGGGGGDDDRARDPADDSSADPCGATQGALPAPFCGEGACSCCTSCGPTDELCMTLDSSLTLGYGHCRAAAGAGTMTATVDGGAFAATEVAAVASETYVHVIGRIAGPTEQDLRQISFQLPATLGTSDCVATPTMILAYRAAGTIAWNRPVSDRPPCTVTLTSIGDIGGRIEGTFAITLLDGATSVDITNGAFSVERGVYP